MIPKEEPKNENIFTSIAVVIAVGVVLAKESANENYEIKTSTDYKRRA